MLKLLFLIIISFGTQLHANTYTEVDVQNNIEAKKLLLDLPTVKYEINKINSIEDLSFTQSYIVTHSKPLPNELSSELYIANHHVIMFLSHNHKYICEIRINLIWNMSTPYTINHKHSKTAQKFRCYERI